MDENVYDMFASVNGTKLENPIPCAYRRINFALGVMLGQNPDNTIDRSIWYASRLMNSVEKNYTTKKEALAMIYIVKKFKHYLLGNSFIFFIDHQALLYIVNKLTVRRWITKWLLMLQEFDFKVVYKLNQVHFLLYHLSKINHGESTKGINEELFDVHLFNVGVD